MKLAPIPNGEGSSLALPSDYHLLLPGPYYSNSEYKSYADNCEGYIILDNGVAEGKQFSMATIWDLADYIAADEIVVPDALDDWEETVRLAENFGTTAKRLKTNDGQFMYNYMAVVQGRTHEEYMRCFNRFLSMSWVTCIGVPRRMVKNLGSKWARVSFLETIQAKGIECGLDFHALGASHWMRECVLLDEVGARGMDTSLPFVLGIERLDITSAEYIERQPDFFERQLDDNQRTVIEHNIDYMRLWANAFPKAPNGRMRELPTSG